MIGVIKYIYQKNSGFSIFTHLLRGVSFQLFKRLTGATISKKLFNGKQIFMFPNCTVAGVFAYTDIPDKTEIMKLREILVSSKPSCFLDIGANVGSYSICLMDVCDRVIAFEPHPFTSSRCRMNFLLNGLPADSVKQLALSDQKGTSYFSDFGSSSSVNQLMTSKTGIEVEVTTLDDFVQSQGFSKETRFVLKIDVEGYEMNVFRGGASFLTESRIAAVVFEVFNLAPVEAILRGYGFNRFTQLSENNYCATKE